MRPSPEWQVSQWLNGPPLSLAGLRGRVVQLHAFQMLCPGCVLHGLPQTQRVARLLAGTPLTVVGLHTVFEHHAVMGPEVLAVFLAEHGYGFPVGIDAAGPTGDPLPRTMRAYGLEGTPTTLLIDAHGRLRHRLFGVEEELALGVRLGRLLQEVEGAADAPR